MALSKRLTGYSDVLLSLGVIIILMVMIFPLNPAIMDLLIALNLAIGLLILMVSMYITHPLQFSVFPGLLLIITLFRLSLNVASTRLILGQAYAGKIILAFGDFVVKGNYVVGLIIFLILVIINFVVITKGAGRVAEVAARFTLDSMPGKQMAIDADLSAGLIDENEARRRREEITQEADFYGSMDGASKFVRGDAIAGLVITLLNILGGLIIGVVQHHMAVGEAVKTYTRLTVGDGLVSQIPALVVSTAAGLVVTRTATDTNLGRDVTSQIFHNPRAIFIASGVMFTFGIIPGLPILPFVLLGIITGAVGFLARGEESAVEEEVEEETPEQGEEGEEVENLLRVDPLELEIGYGLIPLVDQEQGGDLLVRITQLRKQCATEIGIIVPPIRIRDNIQLKANEYMVLIRGSEAARSELILGRYLALNPGTVEQGNQVEGIKVTEPAFGLPAVWISSDEREKAELMGYTVVEPVAVLTTHLLEVIKSNAHRLIGRQEVSNLLENLKKEQPVLVEELVPNLLPLGVVERVLQNLLKERVSIRNLVEILETLSDYALMTKDGEILTEYVRQSMGFTIVKPYLNESGILQGITLDAGVEQLFISAVQEMSKNGASSQMGQVILPPELLQKFYVKLKEEVEKVLNVGIQPVLITSPGIRLYVRRLIENNFPNLVVISIAEIPSAVEIESLGSVRIDNES
ncbi:flagellar biosynthesis protein FlhA [candidate division KSB1 bacterium]|nr:MAG: flagellar biosynthesis protein FlhA [candidate division KSB1 bacterium]